MRRIPHFVMHQPRDLAEASHLLMEMGDEARLYAGGTELLIAMKLRVLRYGHLVDLKTVDGLGRIEHRDGSVRIGALATHGQVQQSGIVRRYTPVLSQVASVIANSRVRAFGTVGGNLCFAEPHSDLAAVLLCLGAEATVSAGDGTRRLGIDELLAGSYETALAAHEILVGVDVPVTAHGWGAAHGKFQVHERPSLSLAVALQVDRPGANVTAARVAIGCVGPVPTRSSVAETLLVGAVKDVENRLAAAFERVADDLDVVEDEEGSADYKRHLVGVFLRSQFGRALTAARAST